MKRLNLKNFQPHSYEQKGWVFRQSDGSVVELVAGSLPRAKRRVSGLASFLPVPVNGRKLSRHGKSRLRISPGSNNGVYWSRCIFLTESKKRCQLSVGLQPY